MTRVISFFIFLTFMVAQAPGQMVCQPLKGPQRPAPVMQYDNTLLRDDVVRVALVIKGQPHTSNRIDAATLQVAGGHAMQAVDIDGVDFKRYFQYEDEGEIPLEIDFPPVSGAHHGQKAKLTILGIFGQAEIEIIL